MFLSKGIELLKIIFVKFMGCNFDRTHNFNVYKTYLSYNEEIVEIFLLILI